ncbi:MAG: valine--tRNA ligase, partial [Pseudomonadota bacterium]
IATTRPETMLGDGAVAVHPSDERYAPIVGQLCEIPVGPREHRRLIPIILDEYPDPDFGSGAVKITGAHDFNDYEVAKRGGIPMYRLMDTRGTMRADGAPYAKDAEIAMAVSKGERTLSEAECDAINLVPEDLRGLDRFEARKAVVEQITSEGLAVMVEGEEGLKPLVENKPIMQPFGDRSKVVIEPMLTDQWFVDTEKVVGPALDAVRNGTTQIVPEREKKVYYNWLDNIEPWCISRQLWWGHQIPVWFDDDGNQYCANTEIEAQAMAPGKALNRDPDVLDTWFSSGLWPIGTLGWPAKTAELKRYFPTSDLITGTDILFFWVARMMMMQLSVVGEIPFKNVYLHGLVRDAKGKKMSKSLGNVIDPLELIDQYGADPLRFASAAMASLGGTLKLDTKRIEGYRNFGTKLWNAAKFAEMNGALGAGERPSPEATVNRWIIGETAKARAAVDDALGAYRFNDAALALYQYVWNIVCDWYLEFSKPLLADDATKAETQATLAWVIDQCLLLLHPMMPFVTEEIWGQTERTKRLIHGDWPEYGSELIDKDADAEVNWTIALIEAVRSARAQMNVPASAHVPLVQTAIDATGEAALAENMALIQRLARVSDVSTSTEMPRGTITVAAPGAVFGMPLADLIDPAAEEARLSKSAAKLDKEINGLEGRVNNPKFVESAPDEVVEEAKSNLAARQEERARLAEALARLSEMG